MQSWQQQQAEQQAAHAAGDKASGAARSPLSDQALDALAEMAALSWSVKQHYGSQVKLARQTARAEWQLTGRSLMLAAALVVCFGAGVVLLWGSLLLALGYTVWLASASLLLTGTALLLLQCILLWWCWRSLSYVVSQAGFSKTWQQVRRLLVLSKRQQNHVD